MIAGFAPVSDPRFVLVVMVDDPRGGKHFGGEVAAPTFGQIMSDALRLHRVAPDAPESTREIAARRGGLETDA